MLMVPVEQPLDGFTHIGKQVPTVSHLDSAGRTLCGAIRIGPGAITANDLDTWVLLQPGRECFSSAIRQEIHGTLSLQVDEDGAILAALLPGPVVNAQHAGCWCIGCLLPSNQSQQRVRTGRYFEPVNKPCASFAAQGQAEQSLNVRQTLSPARRLGSKIWQPFSESPALAVRIGTQEAPDSQPQANTLARQR